MIPFSHEQVTVDGYVDPSGEVRSLAFVSEGGLEPFAYAGVLSTDFRVAAA